MRTILSKLIHFPATNKKELSNSELLYTHSKCSFTSISDDHHEIQAQGLCTDVQLNNDLLIDKNIRKSHSFYFPHNFLNDWKNLQNVQVLLTEENAMFGESSECWFLRHIKSQQVVVAKVALFKNNSSVTESKTFQDYKTSREKKHWEKVSMHPNFYPLLGTIELENRSCFLTGNIPCTTIASLIDSSGSLQGNDACMIAAQIVLAVAHLHENGIVHQSLTPDIISIDWRGRVRITDLSTCEQPGCALELDAMNRIKYPYVAPEILKGHCFEPCSDWWNVGCCLYQMLTGKQLFSQSEIQVLFKNMLKDYCKEAIDEIIKMPIEFPKELSQNSVSILSSLLERDCNKRLKWNHETGIKEIKEHPFFSSINWDELNTNESVGTIKMDLSHCTWTSENTQVHQLLGSDYGGTYSRCHIISHLKTNEDGVMKIVWKAEMRKTQSGWKRVMNERLVWQKISGHPYMLSLKGFFETEAAYCFVTEHIINAVSLSIVIKSAPLPEDVVKVLSGQIAVALDFLHQNGILHRSLSPDCVLVDKWGRLRLCDFENAKCTQYSCHACGDSTFIAPEIIQGKEYGKEADWWSFGIIIFEMIVGNAPLDIYCEKKEIQDNAITTEILLRTVESIPKLLTSITSLPARRLLRDLLTFIPENRLGFKRNSYQQLKCHSFYKGLMWKKLETPDDEEIKIIV